MRSTVWQKWQLAYLFLRTRLPTQVILLSMGVMRPPQQERPSQGLGLGGVIAAKAKGHCPLPCREGSQCRALPPKEELIIRNTRLTRNRRRSAGNRELGRRPFTGGTRGG